MFSSLPLPSLIVTAVGAKQLLFLHLFPFSKGRTRVRVELPEERKGAQRGSL